MARPKARWTGVIRFPDLDLAVDGWLHSSSGRGKNLLPIVQVHAECRTKIVSKRLSSAEKAKETEAVVEAVEPTPVTRTVRCPKCNRTLQSDEIATAIEADDRLIVITVEEEAELRSRPQQAVEARLVAHDSQLLMTIGTGRRLYFFPKGDSAQAYYELWTVLNRAKCVGFVPEMVVDKKSYVVIIRAARMDAAVFGHTRRILIVEELNDPNLLKDPLDFKLLPAEEPRVSRSRADQLVKKAKRTKITLDFSLCDDPGRRRRRMFVQQKIQAVPRQE